MSTEKVYEAWAPPYAIWSTWAKPVLFAYVDRVAVADELTETAAIDIAWAPVADGTTAIVLDLPGGIGVYTGIALATAGFRPVPLYNAIPDPLFRRDDSLLNEPASTIVPVGEILLGLVRAAPKLTAIRLSPDAPPVFLLDANRRRGTVAALPGKFDNRSVSLATDFPSANFMLSRGIQKAVLVQSESLTAQPDLAHTLLRWQQAGIEILAKSLSDPQPPSPVAIQRPSHFRLFYYNFLAALGLKRSPFGGFGGHLPEPSSGHGG